MPDKFSIQCPGCGKIQKISSRSLYTSCRGDLLMVDASGSARILWMSGSDRILTKDRKDSDIFDDRIERIEEFKFGQTIPRRIRY